MSTLLYRQNMLDHAKNPRNFGEIDDPTVSIKAINRHCGDEIKLYIKKEGDTVKDFKYTGTGCAVAMASASMLSEIIVGKKIEDLKHITKQEVLSNFGDTLTPSRQKCALLAYQGLQDLLQEI